MGFKEVYATPEGSRGVERCLSCGLILFVLSKKKHEKPIENTPENPPKPSGREGGAEPLASN